MKRKWLIAILLVTFFLMPIYIPTNAQGPNPPSDADSYQEVIERYGLQSVDAAPEGVTPLEFDSPAELDEFLAEFYHQDQTCEQNQYFGNNEFDFPMLTPEAITYFVVTKSCSVNISLAKFNTWADIRVAVYSSTYRWIDSVLNTRTGLTGVTMGFSLTNEYSYAYNQTTTSVSVKGGGIVNGYFLVNGGILVFSTPQSCSFTYRVY